MDINKLPKEEVEKLKSIEKDVMEQMKEKKRVFSRIPLIQTLRIMEEELELSSRWELIKLLALSNNGYEMVSISDNIWGTFFKTKGGNLQKNLRQLQSKGYLSRLTSDFIPGINGRVRRIKINTDKLWGEESEEYKDSVYRRALQERLLIFLTMVRDNLIQELKEEDKK